MKLLQSLAVLVFGGVFLAGCNPKKDEPDPAAADATTTDESAAPVSPTEMPPPPTDTAPTDQPVPPTTEPVPEPAPPPNG